MDSNLLIALLAGACGLVLIVVLTLAANLVVGLVRARNQKKQNEGDIARWLMIHASHTRDIATLRAEVQRLGQAKNGDVKDTQRIFERIRQLEEDVKALRDKPAPRRSRRDDYDEDEGEDDRYVRRPSNGRSARVYR